MRVQTGLEVSGTFGGVRYLWWLERGAKEGTAIFLRSLAQLIRWLRQDRRRRVTFNCTGQAGLRAEEGNRSGASWVDVDC